VPTKSMVSISSSDWLVSQGNSENTSGSEKEEADSTEVSWISPERRLGCTEGVSKGAYPSSSPGNQGCPHRHRDHAGLPPQRSLGCPLLRSGDR
jgi:hypothetical protein